MLVMFRPTPMLAKDKSQIVTMLTQLRFFAAQCSLKSFFLSAT